MNTLAKIVLGFVAVALILCLFSAVGGFLLLRSTGRAIANNIETEPSKANQVADSIAEYTVPAGFGNPYSVKLAGFSLVGYTGDDGHSHIYLVQVPAYLPLGQADIERQLRENAPEGSYDRTTRMEVIDQQKVTIRGQEVTLLVSEGTNHEGQAFRTVSGMFQGKGGRTLVNVSAPVDAWDQATVDSFLASIQ